MKVASIWDVFGAILLLAIIAVILTKQNTAGDIQALGGVFTSSLAAASSGGSPAPAPAAAPRKR